jgi:hypothetical protein
MTVRRTGIVVVAVAIAGAAACHDQNNAGPAPSDGGPSVDPCPACVTDADCHGGVCAQLGAESSCAPACPDGNECDPDRACVAASNVAGDQVSVCVPRADECGLASEPVPDTGPPSTCPGLDAPDTASTCTSCASGANCQKNGCYGGWWCNTGTSRCQAPPTDCGSAGVAFDGGAPVTGTVGANGGQLSRLYFAIVGDTRPPTPDDTPGYPKTVINRIYADIEALSPRPAFVIATGDYMFANLGGSQAGPQLDLYLAARAQYSGVLFPALGNHECTGATASNCGPGNANGSTTNYLAYLQKLLGPIGKTDPYYSVRIDASDGSWTSKVVVVAANAWSDAQGAWLDAELAKETTYTFVVRHEGAQANTAPGVNPAEGIMAKHPYTLSLVGHAHTYFHFAGTREVVVGNGGAPLSTGKNFGYAIVQQRPDAAIQVDMLDYVASKADVGFHFAVNAAGQQVP